MSETKNPHEGGSYLRDPKTGALERKEFTPPHRAPHERQAEAAAQPAPAAEKPIEPKQDAKKKDAE